MGLLTLCTWWFCPLPVTNFLFVTKNCVKEVNLPQSVWLIPSVFVICDGNCFLPDLVDWREGSWPV